MNNKSPGLDVIAPKILKETVEQLSMALAHVVFNTQVKIPWYRNQHNKLDRAMAYRQDTQGSGRWRGFKLETSFEWGTTRICAKAYLICNIHQ